MKVEKAVSGGGPVTPSDPRTGGTLAHIALARITRLIQRALRMKLQIPSVLLFLAQA